MAKPIKELSGETLHSINDAIKSVFKDYTKQEDKVMARPTKKQSVITKLSDESSDYKDKIMKIADKIIEPDDDISEGQIELMKIQYNTLKTLRSIVDLRIADLQD